MRWCRCPSTGRTEGSKCRWASARAKRSLTNAKISRNAKRIASSNAQRCGFIKDDELICSEKTVANVSGGEFNELVLRHKFHAFTTEADHHHLRIGSGGPVDAGLDRLPASSAPASERPT